jgi:glycosyltransferase involved in cell wall biosynthesis
MRVLIFNTRLDSAKCWGGDSTQVIETEKALIHMGIETKVISSAPENIREYDVIHIFNMQTIGNGIDVIKSAKLNKVPIVFSTLYWDLRYAMEEDLVKYSIGRLYTSLARISPLLALNLYKMRYYYGNARQKRLQRKVLSEVALILPNSVAELEILVQHFDMPILRARSMIVPNAVSCKSTSLCDDKMKECMLPSEYMLMAAGFHPVKGQHRLIEALRDNKEIPIVFAGRIDKTSVYGQYCIQLAEQRGNTYILGAINHEDMPALYSHAKIHVLPSLRESPGLSSLEAAIYGANCVVSSHAPVWEYFKNEAFVCDPLDPDSIKESVLAAWKSAPRSELKKMILQEFTWTKAAEITLQAYKQVIRRKVIAYNSN